MASIYHLKPAFQGFLRPLTQRLANNGITANQVTVFAALLSMISASLIVLFPTHNWPLALVAPVLLVRMALNAIDGMLAREHNMQSDLGTFLNELGDVIADIALYLPLALVPGIPAMLVVAVVIASVITEMTGVISVMIGGQRRYDGPMGKSDRAFVLGLTTLLLGFGVHAAAWSTALLSGVLLLSVLTIYCRIASALACH